MQQLLNIKRVPIEIEINVQRAELKLISDGGKRVPYVNVSRQNNGICLQADPVQVDLSNINPRKFDSFSASGDEEFSITYQGYAKLNSDEENNMKSNDVSEPVKAKKISRSIESILSALPKNKNNNGVSWANGKLSIDYKVDDDNELLDLAKQKYEFIPGKIEFIINQQPGLEIEYLGDPIYFPRSADPNYEPIVDIFA